MRDNFSAAIKRLLAGRAGHHCSNPGCGQPTSGPALDENKIVNVGEAAHITAAARGGKRYDPSLTPEERSAESNGIWLCKQCAGLIDQDDERFTTPVLHKWKRDAVERALKNITTRVPGAGRRVIVVTDEDDEDREFLRGLALPDSDNIEAVVARMRDAAARDIAAFRGAKDWPAHTIPLTLTLHAGEAKQPISVEGMADGIDVAETLNLVASPGTGKTTTLVQLAGNILETTQLVAVLVPLGEWSDRRDDFFTFLTGRNAFGAFRRQHFMQLAYHGRLRLLLDGWNELDPDSRISATRLLKTLRREYPILGIVIGTRRHQLPLSGPTVEIEALSEDQQLELARSLRGRDGEALVEQARRTPGVRELIAIPLYLTALLGIAPGARFPQTKEEVLRAFVTRHEQVPEKAEILRRELFGFHTDMLIGLAAEANRAANTVLSETTARRVITDVGTGLVAHKQLTVAPQPTTVIDTLVNGHILVRSSSGDGISFQHQQFQEWYASFDVEWLLTQAAGGKAEPRSKLRVEILNWPAWEESILFACERLSRENAAGAQAVTAAIRDTLEIDPMLAAEMIFRSAPTVWTVIGGEAVAFAARWHTAGKVDRAARFMMMTGRPEFAPQIWALISNPDDQVHIDAVRSPPRFRPSVLGEDAEVKLAALPEETRCRVVGEIASDSGIDGMELAARVALTDASAAVVLEVLQAFQFRRANSLVHDIMASARDEVWTLVARNGYPDRLADPTQNARLNELRRALAAERTGPLEELAQLTGHSDDAAAARERITEIVASAEFPVRSDHAYMALRQAYEVAPAAVCDGLLRRIGAGLELPFQAEDLLKNIAVIDDGPVAAAALRMETSERVASSAFRIVGPRTVGTLMDRIFILDEEFRQGGRSLDQAKRNEYQRWRDAIANARMESFLAALLERADSDQPLRIALMADFIAWHQRQDEEATPVAGDELRPSLVRVIARWIETLLRSPRANRHQFAEVVNAVARVPDAQFVPGLHQMLERDLTDRARAKDQYMRSARRGPLTPDVTHDHTTEYQRAFAAIGGDATVDLMKGYLPDLRFGTRAAGALCEIWHREHPPAETRRFASWPDYARVKTIHAQRRDAPETLTTCDFAEAIFAVVRSLGTPQADDATQQHAVMLGITGLGLPHGSKRAEIDALMALPLPFAAKQKLLMAAAMAGETIPSAALVAGLRELLQVGEREAWRLREDHGEVMPWLELFAFSDHPDAVLGVLDMLPDEYVRYPRGLHRLFWALGKSPREGALDVLLALARRDSRLLEDHDWRDALIKLGTEQAALTLVALICDGEITAGRGGDGYQLSRYLAHFGEQLPSVKDEMLRRYGLMSPRSHNAIIESALIELADPAVISVLIGGYAADQRGYDGGLSNSVRKLALGQRPAEAWGAGAYEEFGVSLTAFRQELFGIAVANEARSALAERSLLAIEKIRDSHGRINDEPRHPDIGSGRPWPIIGQLRA